MGDFILIHPRDPGVGTTASNWARRFGANLTASGHFQTTEVDDSTPADSSHVAAALGGTGSLIGYFGHGDEDNWLTKGAPTVDSSHFVASAGKAVVSIACKTGCNLGPDSVTAGVQSWLGFTCQVAVVNTNSRYPSGDAIVAGLSVAGASKTMREVHDQVYSELDQVMQDYDFGGKFDGHSTAALGYFSALAMRDHLVLHGASNFAPL
jgi:hypothetical protein